jgi:5,10-methylenetetrahydromethanopterin reductase
VFYLPRIPSVDTGTAFQKEADSMRHGLLWIGGGLSIQEMVRISQEAEAADLDSVYCVEAYRSAFVPLTALALGTKRLQVGTYIVNAYGHSPFITGMSAIDVDELSGGRLVLGVGSGNRHINAEFQGMGKDRPVRKLREYVEILREMIRTPLGGSMSYEGEIHSMRWTPNVQPLRNEIPIYLAAIFPGMVKVAGSVADGVGLGVLLSPEYIREVIRPTALAAAEAAGRNPDDLAFPMATLIAVDDDRERARSIIRQTVCMFFHPIPHSYYDFLLREQGFSKAADACRKYVPDGRLDAAMEAMDDELVDRLALAGTAQECAQRLRDYGDVVDEAIYLNVSSAPPAIENATPADAYRGLLQIARL